LWNRKEDLNMKTIVMLQTNLLQSQDLIVGQEKKSCIGFTQKNSIENLVQNYLPYIFKAHGLYLTILAYPK